MKKKIVVIAVSLLICVATTISLFVLFSGRDKNLQVLRLAIKDTNQYMEEKEFETELFGNILQEKLDKSLVYSVKKDVYLIEYGEKLYTYQNGKLEASLDEYKIFDNLEYAMANALVGEYIFTRGYNEPYDGGNSYYQVCEYLKDSQFADISSVDRNITLKFITNNSTVNIYQMGYDSGDISECVNNFTKYVGYKNIFIPKGDYLVTDNFDVNVENKSYLGYEAKIYSNDTFSPKGYNNGCLFYVSNNVSNIKINGINVRVYTNTKLDDPLIGFLQARDVDGIWVNDCSFYLPSEASIYDTSGMIDLFTGWKNVTVKNCRLENFSSTRGGGGVGLRDILKKECQNAVFENNYIYSNCKDEVIAIFSGLDTSLSGDTLGGGNIENVLFKNNIIIGGKYSGSLGPRAVGITVGYQISPVKDICFVDNNITMYSANYLLLYGKTTNLTLENNVFNVDSSYQEGLHTLFYHNVYSQEAFGILVKNNTINMLENSTLKSISATDKEFTFDGNIVNSQYSISRLLDSKSVFINNIFNFEKISGCIYRNIKEVRNNKVNVNSLNVVYEFYELNIESDILIDSDIISAKSIGASFMMFNGTNIKFNGHSVTFKNFIFNTDNVLAQYYYLAYDTTPVKDSGVVNFENSDISVYEESGHNFIPHNDGNKVTLNFS